METNEISAVQGDGKRRGLPAWGVPLFFCLSLPFLEWMLQLADGGCSALTLLRITLSGGAAGLLLWLAGTLIPHKRMARAVVGAALFLWGTLFLAERCCRAFFAVYYQCTFLLRMSGQVAGDFFSTALEVLWKNLWFFPAAFLPFIVFVVFHRALLPESGREELPMQLARLCIVICCLALGACHLGQDASYYTTDYAANSAIPRFGLVNSLRLEAQYALFGQPVSVPVLPAESGAVSEPKPVQPAEQPEPSISQEPAAEPEPVYENNVLPIDFAALMAQESDSTLKTMDQYFLNQQPTAQNAYTGLFKGKNLIVLTAEGFSDAAIDPVLTPTLYRLTHEGFVISNFYQPDWSQSTTGGEFTSMTGLIANWVKGRTAFTASVGKEMPFALGWQLRAQGYQVRAYHNNTYTYYGRDRTHPNLGYDYFGVGNGLALTQYTEWPASDLEMMQQTLPTMIGDYTASGTPFHLYYMTVSGHCNYSLAANAMSRKNWDAVTGMDDAPEPIRAYLASQLELEYALRYVVEELEKAGIAENTVIAMTPDHYPYALTENYDTDYYNVLTGRNDTPDLTSRYRNTMILWSGSMTEPIPVTVPCSAIDLVPTLSNLFGLSYDSRLLSGRDILAGEQLPRGAVTSAMPLVVFADFGRGKSWISNAGVYEASLQNFTPFDGVTVGADYVSQVTEMAQNRWTFSKYILEKDYYRHILPGWNGTEENP